MEYYVIGMQVNTDVCGLINSIVTIVQWFADRRVVSIKSIIFEVMLMWKGGSGNGINSVQNSTYVQMRLLFSRKDALSLIAAPDCFILNVMCLNSF